MTTMQKYNLIEKMQDKNARIHRKRLREFNLIKEEQLSRFCITFVPKSSTLNSYSYLLETI